jgi:tRNA nucleotidyltransferase/poly(A) polymerase
MIALPDFVKKFMNSFTRKGFQIYLVGGTIRDFLLGKKINWSFADFATNATPEKIIKLCPKSYYDNKFGTVGVEITNKKNKIIFEVTTFRTEHGYDDSRHPSDVKWAKTIQEDLSRRDFTINAMAFDGKRLIDLYLGQKHLKEKLLVAVGDPDTRFKEDALRLMRAVRIAAELGFLIENKTRDSIKENAHLIKKISSERIRDELFKIIESDNPAEGVLFLRSTNLLDYVLPELSENFNIPQKSPKRHHVYDVGTHSVMSLKHCPSNDVITRFAALIHDIGKAKTFQKDPQTKLITFYNHEVVGTKITEGIADRLKLSNKDKDKLIRLVKFHQFTVSEKQSDKAIRRFIRNVGKEYIDDMLKMRVGDRLGGGATETSWRLELFKKRLEEVQKEPFKITDLKINGNDVMKMLNIKPGPLVGQILNELFDKVVNKKVQNKRDNLISQLTKLKKIKNPDR